MACTTFILYYDFHQQDLPLPEHIHCGKVLSTPHVCTNISSHVGFQTRLLVWQIPLQIVLFIFASYEKNITLYSDQSWKLGAMSIAAKIWYSIEFYWFFFLSYVQWFTVPLPVKLSWLFFFCVAKFISSFLINDYFNLSCYCFLIYR